MMIMMMALIKNRPSSKLEVILRGPGPFSVTEFASLTKCADDFVRYIFECEASELLRQLQVPADTRLAILQRMHRFSRRQPTPAYLNSVSKNSWHLTATLTVLGLLYVLKNYIEPIIKDAFEESQIREAFKEYLLTHCFGGATQSAEDKARENQNYGPLRIVAVEEEEVVEAKADVLLKSKHFRITLERRSDIKLDLSNAKRITKGFFKGMGCKENIGKENQYL